MRPETATPPDGPEEREAKLLVEAGFVLPSPAILRGVTAVDRGDERLHAIYWDTDDLRLARAGVGVRHRNGVWTFKGRSRRDGDAVVREEVEAQGEPDAIHPVVRAHVERWAGGEAVHPVAELDTVRHTVDATAGDERAEVVHDRVRIMDGDREVARFAEVEVEFELHSAALADRLVRLLVEHGGVVHTTPKLVRALRELGHDPPEMTG
jgi:inorganic triphosphatase YgiF